MLDEFLGHRSDAVRNPPRGKIPEESEKYLVEWTDASQEQAVWQARESKIMLLKGPPGTGKSQTIVNLIGDALKNNKSVALVCRKQAALDVVKKRLKGVDLGHLAVNITEPRKQRKSVINELIAIKEGKREIDDKVNKKPQERLSCSERIVSLEKKREDIFKSRGEGENYSIRGHLCGTISLIHENMKFTPYDLNHKRFVQSVSNIIATNFSLEDEREKLKRFSQDYKSFDYANNKWKNAGVDKNDAGNVAQFFSPLIAHAEHLDRLGKDLPDERLWNFLFNRVMRNFVAQLFGIDKKDTIGKMVEFIRHTEEVFAMAKMPLCPPIWRDVYHGMSGATYQSYEDDIKYLPQIAFINERKKIPVIRTFMEYNESNWDMTHWEDITHAIYCYAKLIKLPKVHLDKIEEERNRADFRKAVDEKRNHDSKSIRRVFMGRQQAASMLYQKGLLQLKKGPKQKGRNVQPSTIRKIAHDGRDELNKIYPALLMNPDSMCQVLPLETGVIDLAIVDEASQMFLIDAMPILYRAKRIVVSGDNMQMPPDENFTLQEDEEDEENEENKKDEHETETEEVFAPRTYELLEATDALAESEDIHCRLNVHYRSRPAELIAFSNHAFYDGRLQAAPDNGGLRSPLRTPIEIVHVSGKRRKVKNGVINDEEINEIINQLERIWSDSNPPSVGVIVFNITQEKEFKKRFEEKCQEDKDFADKYRNSQMSQDEDGEDTGFFVRSVENVQGDERDIIVLGTTYDNEGNYGLLSRTEKGRRRLNVAITRAKHGMIVITSLDINNISKDTEGPNAPSGDSRERWYLWKFMEYARAVSNNDKEDAAKKLRSINPEYSRPIPIGHGPDSQFEIDVADYIRKLNYITDYQIGEGGFRIDLGVKRTEKDKRYLCGIECDGRVWHDNWCARHNDIWRQKILESKGWNIYRIWSDHWYDHSDDTKTELHDYLENLVKEAQNSQDEKTD